MAQSFNRSRQILATLELGRSGRLAGVALGLLFVIVTILTIQGLGYLLPTNLRVYLELRKARPDGAKISTMMSRYFYVVAFQGAMQVAIIVVMARFATGL